MHLLWARLFAAVAAEAISPVASADTNIEYASTYVNLVRQQELDTQPPKDKTDASHCRVSRA